MEIKEAQVAVDNWIKKYGVRYFNEMTNMALLMEEVGEEDLRKIIAQFAQQNNILVLTLRVEEKTLEEVFKELTK